MIPRAATAMGCLVESDVLSQHAFVGDGRIRPSPLGAVAATLYRCMETMTSWRRLSPDVDLAQIDLTAGEHGRRRSASSPDPVLKVICTGRDRVQCG